MRIAFLLLLLTLTASCVTREEIEVAIWMNNFNAQELKEICEREPVMNQVGFYRKLNDGRLELVSVCKKEAHEFLEMTKTDFNTILDKTLPKPPEAN